MAAAQLCELRSAAFTQYHKIDIFVRLHEGAGFERSVHTAVPVQSFRQVAGAAQLRRPITAMHERIATIPGAWRSISALFRCKELQTLICRG
jgi:hypothetical protein